MINSIVYILDIPLMLLVTFAYVFFTITPNGLTRRQYKLIKVAFAEEFIFTIVELTYGMIGMGYLKVTYDTLYVIDIIYNFTVLLSGIIWCMVAFAFMQKLSFLANAILFAIAIVGVIFFVCEIGFKGSKLFVCMEEGQISYGTLSHFWAVFCFTPLALLLGVAIANFWSKEEYANRDKIKPFLVFPIVHVAFGIFQVIYPFSFFTITGLGVASLYLYITLNTSLILEDKTTGLPNRRQMIRDIDSLISDKTGWSIMTFDVEGREDIYAEFGSGEKEIISAILSEVMADVCMSYSCKAYAFSDDRFVLICENNNSMYADQICATVETITENQSLEKKLPYKINIFSDYVCIDEETTLTIPDIISLIKKQMVAKKKKYE